MDTASSAFHDAKVAHVTGHGGSSAADVFGVVIGTAVWAIMAHRGCTLSSTSPTIFTTLKTRSAWLSLGYEALPVVVPIVASQMVPDSFGPVQCCVAALLATFGTTLALAQAQGSHEATSISNPRNTATSSTTAVTAAGRQRPRSAVITVYRGMIMLMTACAILAVDFHAFPRRFAKTETFGISLMDLGVGGAVFSSGLVAGAPSKLAQAPKAADLWAAPILVVLGLGRVVTVKATNYVEHASEYGVHWNFFFTLAAVTLCHTLLRATAQAIRLPLSSVVLFVIASALAAAQHYLLTARGFGEWVMAEGPRDNVVDANREGLVSMLGYCAIFEIGCTCGSIYLGAFSAAAGDDGGAGRKKDDGAASASAASGRGSGGRGQGRRGGIGRAVLGVDDQTAAALRWGVAAVLFVAALYKHGGDPSRRLVNGGYIALVVTLNVLCLLAIWAALKAADYGSGAAGRGLPFAGAETGSLFGLISKHQMPTFLGANLLTGAVNLSTDTLQYSQWVAVVIVSAYLLIVCFVAGLVDKLLK